MWPELALTHWCRLCDTPCTWCRSTSALQSSSPCNTGNWTSTVIDVRMWWCHTLIKLISRLSGWSHYWRSERRVKHSHDNDTLPDSIIWLPHSPSPWTRFTAVNVEWGLISSTMSFRTWFVIILEDLDASVRLPEVRSHQPLRPSEGVVEVLLGGVVLVAGSTIVFSDEREESSPLVLPDRGLTNQRSVS